MANASPAVRQEYQQEIEEKLSHHFSVEPSDATHEQMYTALALTLRDRMRARRVEFIRRADEQKAKQVYYMSMEFLVGRSLKNALYNLNLLDDTEAIMKTYGIKLDTLLALEPDAGLGNGGLGRLAACFLDALASSGVPAIGYSLLYEYGIFRQKLIDGWQTELPDRWLPRGKCWLLPRPERAQRVVFGGHVDEWWDDNGHHHVNHVDGTVIIAEPYDLMCAGKDGEGVSTLRLWRATANDMDMHLFNQGEYMRAMEKRAMAEVITQVLYPADNHREGKSLRLSQQYFLASASMQDLVRRHLEKHGTLDSLPDLAAVHINDTHPTLAIPELMRILIDECGYGWEKAYDIVSRTFAYTNHTVMAEALECWPEDLFRERLPRIYTIVRELHRRHLAAMTEATHGDAQKESEMAIIRYGVIRMANLCVAVCHKINGVSALHSELVKRTVFPTAYEIMPDKFTNVTNGIAHRRWLCQANPTLSAWIHHKIGDGFIYDASELARLTPYAEDAAALEEFAAIKRHNKERFARFVASQTGQTLNVDSLFDVQVKRLHEYKRQHLNAMHILHTYLALKDNPSADFTPRTYIFGAKAAPSYTLAKEIIRFICGLRDIIERDKAVRDKLKIVYVEDYRVTLAELLMPAADISEQISLAGTEASGTGNMKLMMNGALTLGTLDGANVEICDAVGEENMFLFGMRTNEVEQLRRAGYDPRALYKKNPALRRVVDAMTRGFGGEGFSDLTTALLTADTYMALADFDDYCRAQRESADLYRRRDEWARRALLNTAASGIFSADRAIADYNERIWHAKPVI